MATGPSVAVSNALAPDDRGGRMTCTFRSIIALAVTASFGTPTLAQNLDVKGTITGEGSVSFWQNVSVGGALTVQGKAVAGDAQVPSGGLIPFAGSVAPSGFLLCDGAAVSRTTYPALFAVIGTTYGAGDGSTTFNVPDLRGRAPIGAGQGAGLTNRALGATGGEESHALATAELPAHNHGVTDPGHLHWGYGAGGSGWSFAAMYSLTVQAPTGQGVQATQAATTGVTTQNAGSGAAHNNMQPWRALNFIIKT